MPDHVDNDREKEAHLEHDPRQDETYLVYRRDRDKPHLDPDVFDFPIEPRYVRSYAEFKPEVERFEGEASSHTDREYVEIAYIHPDTEEAVKIYNPFNPENVTSPPIADKDWFYLDKDGIKFKRHADDNPDDSRTKYTLWIERDAIETAIEIGYEMYVMQYWIKEGESPDGTSRLTEPKRAVHLLLQEGDGNGA